MAYFPLTKPTRYTEGGTAATPFAQGALQNAAQLQKYGQPVTQQSLQNLYALLVGQGRVDPRLLARLQAQNSTSTRQQADTARATLAKRGMGGGGFSDALLGSINAAGADRASSLNYQDLADSYQRNQENLGLANQLVTQPQLGYASLSSDLYRTKSESDAQTKAARLGVIGSVFQGIGGMFGGK